MDPVENLLMIAPDSVYNVTAYYTTCSGANPLDPSLQSAEQIIAGGQVAGKLHYLLIISIFFAYYLNFSIRVPPL